MRRGWLWLVVLVGIAALAVVVWRAGGERGKTSAGVREEPEQEAARPSEPAFAADVPLAEARAPSVESEPVAMRSEAAPSAQLEAPDEEPVRVSGTIVVVDEQGLEHPAEDGFIKFVLWRGNSGSRGRADVERGAWSLVIEPDEEGPVDALTVDRMELAHRPAMLAPDRQQRIDASTKRPLELRARWIPATLLHVRARDSGLELDPVLLRAQHGWNEEQIGHPVSTRTRAPSSRTRA